MGSNKNLPEAPLNTDTSVLPPRGLRILAAARYAGTNSSWSIRRAIWDGKLAARQFGKFQIILKEDLDNFLDGLPTVEANEATWLQKRRKVQATA